jgi:hypothetical protein
MSLSGAVAWPAPSPGPRLRMRPRREAVPAPRRERETGGASRLAPPVRSFRSGYAQGVAAAVQSLITPVVKLMALLLCGVPIAARQAPLAMLASPAHV